MARYRNGGVQSFRAIHAKRRNPCFFFLFFYNKCYWTRNWNVPKEYDVTCGSASLQRCVERIGNRTRSRKVEFVHNGVGRTNEEESGGLRRRYRSSEFGARRCTTPANGTVHVDCRKVAEPTAIALRGQMSEERKGKGEACTEKRERTG